VYKIGDLVVNTMGYSEHLYGHGIITEVMRLGAFDKPSHVRVLWSKSPSSRSGIHVKFLKHLDERKREINS
jgi:hypothetical protein